MASSPEAEASAGLTRTTSRASSRFFRRNSSISAAPSSPVLPGRLARAWSHVSQPVNRKDLRVLEADWQKLREKAGDNEDDRQKELDTTAPSLAARWVDVHTHRHRGETEEPYLERMKSLWEGVKAEEGHLEAKARSPDAQRLPPFDRHNLLAEKYLTSKKVKYLKQRLPHLAELPPQGEDQGPFVPLDRNRFPNIQPPWQR
ncbi:hypothetical protein JCM10213_000737 [Rhodosporidiobolus nylandii]